MWISEIKELIKIINQYYPSLKYFYIDKNELKGDWLIVKICPMPNEDEIPLIISDIKNDKVVYVDKGKLFHDKCCKNQHIEDVSFLNDIKKLERVEYTIGIFNPFKVNNQMPWIVSIDPSISYAIYPSHPHINLGNWYRPDSLCLTKDYMILGNTLEEYILKLLDLTSIWLFRHQVWAATKEYYGKGIWIGPQDESDVKPEVFLHHLNPIQTCRCGSNKSYYSCCMPYHISKCEHISLEKATKKALNYLPYLNKWKDVQITKLYTINELKKMIQ